MFYSRLMIGAVLASVAVTPASAQDVKAAAKAFGAREAVQSPALSPGGNRMAFLAPSAGQGNSLWVVDIDREGTPRRALVASGNPERLHRCGWVSDARLVCTLYVVRAGAGDTLSLSRMIAVNHDGSGLKLVSRRQSDNQLYFAAHGGDVVDWLPGQSGAVLVARQYVPESQIGSNIERRQDGLGVDRLDTLTLASKRVVAPIKNAVEYISDGSGNVRIMGLRGVKGSGYTTGEIKYFFRDAGGDNGSRWATMTF